MAFPNGVLWMPDNLTLELPNDNFLHTSIIWSATGWKVNVATVSADDRHVDYCYKMLLLLRHVGGLVIAPAVRMLGEVLSHFDNPIHAALLSVLRAGGNKLHPSIGLPFGHP